MVRGTLKLPHGSGKTVRTIVFTENPDEAKAAGADEAGLDDLIEKVLGGWTDDVALSTTSAMKSVRGSLVYSDPVVDAKSQVRRRTTSRQASRRSRVVAWSSRSIRLRRLLW